MIPRPDTMKRLKLICAAVQRGESDSRIAATLGCTVDNIWALRKRYGLPKQPLTGPTHGLRSTYADYGCRCEKCREANNSFHKKERKLRRQRIETSTFKHGASAYNNWGCRCEVCTKAWAERNNPAGRRYRKRHPDRVNKRVRKYRARLQAETLEQAHHHYYKWTGPEMEIAGRMDLTTKQAAFMLGRTYAAVHAMRRRLADDPKAINAAGLSRASLNVGTDG